MQTIFNTIISRLHRDEEGASAVEYGLLVGLIAVAIIAAVIALGGSLSGMFDGVATELGGVEGGAVIIQ